MTLSCNYPGSTFESPVRPRLSTGTDRGIHRDASGRGIPIVVVEFGPSRRGPRPSLI